LDPFRFVALLETLRCNEILVKTDNIHQVDAEKVARQLGMSLSTIPPKFTTLRKRYNIDIKVINSGALQRNRSNTPKKAKSRSNLQAVKPAEPVPWPEDALEGVEVQSPSPIKSEESNSP